MQQPVEVQVEHEQIVQRLAAIDVAKASGMVCLRTPHETVPGRRLTDVLGVSGRAMIEGLIIAQHTALAELAKGPARRKRAAMEQAP